MSKITKAVQSALSSKQATSMESRKLAALAALGVAMLDTLECARNATQSDANAWEQYALAVAYGSTTEEVRDTMRATVEADGAENGHAESFIKEDREASDNKCRQYAFRVKVLADHGVTLLSAEGVLHSSVSVTAYGQTFEGTLGAVAQRLYAASKGKGAKRGTKGKAAGKGAAEGEGEGEGEGTKGAAPTDESVPITATLVSRVGQALAMVGSDKLRDALISTAPDAILDMAKAINAARIVAKASQAAQAAQAKAKAEETAARMQAAQEANARELAAAGLRKVMPKRAKRARAAA